MSNVLVVLVVLAFPVACLALVLAMAWLEDTLEEAVRPAEVRPFAPVRALPSAQPARSAEVGAPATVVAAEPAPIAAAG